MISTASLASELTDLGRAVGLIDATGNLNTHWFENPLNALSSVLTDPTQRGSLLDLLDALLPPAQLDGLAAGDQWHPLLGSDPALRGSLYVTTRDTGAGIVFGLAGDFNTPEGTTPSASIRVQLPVVKASSGVTAIAGTSDGPLGVVFRLTFDWSTPTNPIGLGDVTLAATIAPLASGGPVESLVVTLGGLDLDGNGPVDTVLDPSQLRSEAFHLVLGLVRAELETLGSGLSAEAQSVATHFLPLLGLSGAGVPPFPFAQLAADPGAVRAWFAGLLQGAAPPITAWLLHLASLLGAAVPVTSGTGTPDDPWTVPVLSFNGSSGLSLTLAEQTAPSGSSLLFGVALSFAPAGAQPALGVQAEATLAALPLAGTAPAAVLPSARFVARAPAAGGASLVSNAPNLAVSSIQGGLAWSGSALSPLLELLDVTLLGTHYDQLDLTHADSVVAAAAAAVVNNVLAALGGGAGQHLAVLAGLVKPTGDPIATAHLVNPADLVTNPARAIAAVHRAVLTDANDNWSFVFGDLTALLGLAGPPAGTGSQTDPWRVTLASAGALAVELVAWNAATGITATDVQQLRVGLRANVQSAPVQFWWLAELLAFDLPSGAAGTAHVLGGEHLNFAVNPVPALAPAAGVGVTADSIQATLDWNPAGGVSWQASVANLALGLGATAVTIPSLEFPVGGFDVSQPAATATALGLAVPQLETALLALLARAANSWGGVTGYTLAGLLGVHQGLPGLPADWPLLADPGPAGSLLSDPFTAVRGWLARVATQTSADGSPFLYDGLAWLEAFLTGALPPALPLSVPAFNAAQSGSGSYDDPWALPLQTAGNPAAELLVWLEPAGPPAAWAQPLGALFTAAGDFPTLLQAALAIAGFIPQLRSAFVALDPGTLAGSLGSLASHLSSSDGVVPLASQIPTGGSWTAGTAITASHDKQPSDPSAIAQILAQADAWAAAAGGQRVVLLLGPAFSDHTAWQPLLADPALHGTTSAAANFNFRVPGVSPAGIDLTAVPAVVDYYTADLNDDGSGNLAALLDQIGRVVERLAVLRPGVAVTIVAHSTAGVPARVYTAANAAAVRGLITLGTPHAGAPLPFLTDAGVGDAVRWAQQSLAQFPASSLRDALAHIILALDGYLPAAAGQLAQATLYPAGSFNFSGAGDTGTGGASALALGGSLPESLLAGLQQALAAQAAAAAGAAMPAPTHVGIGVRAALDLGPDAPGGVAVDGSVRLDAFRVALAPGSPPPARPPHGVAVRTRLSRPDAWFVGAPAAGTPSPTDARVRWAELGVDLASSASGLSCTPRLSLYQASVAAPVNPGLVSITDPQAQALLGAVLRALSTPAPTTSVAGLLAALQALGIAVPDPEGAIGISADAWNAITVDAGSYLGPRLGAALQAGSAGFTGPAGGPWAMPVAGLPLALYVSTSTGAVGLRTDPAATGVLPLGTTATLTFDGSVSLPSFAPLLTASFGLGALTLNWSGSALSVQAPPWLSPFGLVPAPAQAALLAELNHVLPRLLFSGAASAILEGILGPGYQIPPIDTLFTSTRGVLSGSSALGDGSGGLASAKINNLLQLINSAAGLPAGPGLSLPAGLSLSAGGAGSASDPVALHLTTTAPLGGLVTIDLEAAFDQSLHVTPSGTLALDLPLPGSWTGLTAAFGASPAGASLSIAPKLAGVAPIQILPKFSGLGDSLRGALEALLPRALDELVAALGPPTPGSLLQDALAVATAVGVYDAAGGFAAHGDQLRAMTQGNWLSSFGAAARAGVASAIAQLLQSPALGGLPGQFAAVAGTVTWTDTLTGGAAGALSFSVGWDGSGPTALLSCTGFKLQDGGLGANLSAGYGSGNLQCAVQLALSATALASTLDLDVSPTLRAAASGAGFQLALLPLASQAGDGPLTLTLLPTPGATLGPNAAGQLVSDVLLPLVSNLLLDEARPSLTSALWTGGPTLEAVLLKAHFLTKGATPAQDTLAPLPGVTGLASGLLQAFAGLANISLAGTLQLSFVSSGGQGANRLGVAVSGTQQFAVGPYSLAVHFGAPAEWSPGMDEGLALYLFRSGGASLQFVPGLHCVGIGLGLTGQNDAALIDLSQFRLGGLDGYVFFDVELAGGLNFTNFGGGLALDSFGLPLGQATSGNVGGDNPVAASLLQSNGSSGDAHPVNPGVDVAVWSVPTAIVGPPNDGQFHILLGGQQDQDVWIPVHAAFGPIYINQIGVGITADPGAALLIDGSVQVDGLTAQVDELSVTIPFRSLATPSNWTLDLKGLALGFQSPGVTIAGGLLKNDGPPIEYDGMLLVQLTEFGMVAVGAYSKPSDAQGGYTSLFVFAGLFIVIGLPPIIEIDGLGLGVGYNRELIVPTDFNQIDSFILVAALDDAGQFANDPMGELMSIRQSMPAQRGSFWLAVGLHGTSFVIVHVTAIVYVALDRSVEVGVIGVARMALPADDTALVSVELALKARYSTAEGVFSVQGQLTDNSYLLSPDCQLTGGFAYFIWFPQSQFVLSIGGYNPAFQKPPQFPDVPRVGYHWSLLGAINIKGECYFALTNTCVMAGARFEATYGPDAIHVWFTSYADFLVSWDPFYYDADIGVAVGAAFRMQICFIACATIDISVSLSATLTVQGPPLHGTVTVDLAVASVTVAFGPDPAPRPNYITDFGAFRQKYLYGGDPNGYAVATHVLTGLLPSDPPGAQPAPGTSGSPWPMGVEFSFQTESRMPSSREVDFLNGDSGPIPGTTVVDLAPMGPSFDQADCVHNVTLLQKQPDGSWKAPPVDAAHFRIDQNIGQFSEATWRYYDPDAVPAAARTLPALAGITITGTAVLQNQSALVPISKLIDAGNSRPLPFATLTTSYIGLLLNYGASADALAQLTAAQATGAISSIAGQVLSGGGFFSQARQAAGLPAAGLAPVAANALATRRSSPPAIMPITTGLTMRPVGLPHPPVVLSVPPVLPVGLVAPRLRAVLQGRPQPLFDAPIAFRTTVANAAAAAAAPRMAPPRLDVFAGARLQRVAAQASVRPTILARATKTLRSPETGWPLGSADSAALEQAESAVASAGVILAGGATHIWDLPAPPAAPPAGAAAAQAITLSVSGTAAFRATFTTRGGAVLLDQEWPPQVQTSVAVPARAARCILSCLGNPPAGAASSTAGFGTVSFAAAPRAAVTAVGWQAASLLFQAAGSVFLARGSCVVLARPKTPRRAKFPTTHAAVRAAEVLSGEPAIETWLPLSTSVVLIELDQQDPTAAAAGDLAVASAGATLQVPPLLVVGDRRTVLLYQVAQPDPKAGHIAVSVGSLSGWRLGGVVGLPGTVEEWAVRANGGIPETLVPDGPLTQDGAVTVRIVIPAGGTP
jgi:hypothetical protein